MTNFLKFISDFPCFRTGVLEQERNGGTLNIEYSNPSENAITDAKGDVDFIIKDIINTIRGNN